jgi:hypothetical protein
MTDPRSPARWLALPVIAVLCLVGARCVAPDEARADPLAAASALGINPTASKPFAVVAATHAPGSCHMGRAANGMPLPDVGCTPGAINPTLTLAVITNPAFRTGMVRDKATSAKQKRIVFSWYGITPPSHDTGANQVCEIDHLVDLGAGGADTLENLWPQCQRPTDPIVPVGQRFFKLKDAFAEHSVIRLIKAGGTLAHLQRRIAADWTQFLPVAP